MQNAAAPDNYSLKDALKGPTGDGELIALSLPGIRHLITRLIWAEQPCPDHT